MKALAVQQPWASLLCLGIKNVENRSWETKHRGKLLIVASSKKVIRDFLNYMPAELFDTVINEQIFGNVPSDLNDLPTSAVIGYVSIKDCVKGDLYSVWGGSEYQWLVEDAYLFDEPQLVGIKAKLHLFDIPEIDENNLPPAHKVKLKGMRIEEGNLSVDITDKELDSVLETGELRLGFYDATAYYALEGENGIVNFDKVIFNSPTRHISMKKLSCNALSYLDDEDKPKQVPSVLTGGDVDWNVYSIKVGEEESVVVPEMSVVEEEKVMTPEDHFYIMKNVVFVGVLNSDVKVGDKVVIKADEGQFETEIVRIEVSQKLLNSAQSDEYVGIHLSGFTRKDKFTNALIYRR